MKASSLRWVGAVLLVSGVVHCKQATAPDGSAFCPNNCDDGNPCTGDVCGPDGTCANGFNYSPQCECAASAMCNDGDPCTTDECEISGVGSRCVHTVVPSCGAGGGGGSGGGQPLADTDPEDIDPVHGDPSLDVIGSESYVWQGQPWIRVRVAGAWPPPDYYSWYAMVHLQDGSGDVVTLTVELHDGVSSRIPAGIALGDVTFAPEPEGFRVLFGGPPLAVGAYLIESGILKTANGTFVQDFAGPFPLSSSETPFPM